jgi:hypothetical protein
MNKKTMMSWILVIISIVFGGFILFNIAFIALALIVQTFRLQGNPQEFNFLQTFLSLLGYLLLIFVLIYILKKSLNDREFKVAINATLLTVPLMLSLVTFGILFYDNQVLVILTSLGLMIPILLWMTLRKVHPWYYLSWTFVSICAILIYFLDIQI